MSWKQTTIDLKLIPKGTQVVTFKYEGDKVIKSARGGCGCQTTVVKNNTIECRINYNKSISNDVKRILVHFTDSSKDTLTVKAQIK